MFKVAHQETEILTVGLTLNTFLHAKKVFNAEVIRMLFFLIKPLMGEILFSQAKKAFGGFNQ
jgi:hypothetical protein